MNRTCGMLLAAALLFAPQTLKGSEGEPDLSLWRRTAKAFRMVARKAGPAVVHIRSRLPRRALDLAGADKLPAKSESKRVPISYGSGVIIDSNGFILTSYHVVRNALEIHVGLADRREVLGELISFDPLSDLAMLQVPLTDLQAARLGDSDRAEVGDWVLAIGSPLGLQQTVTSGIISATGREFAGDRETDPDLGYQCFIQTDAAIYRGSSGGPLLNLDGEVIGINHSTVGWVNTGLAFATPINLAKNVLDSMKQGLGAPRGRLGAGLLDVDQNMAQALGLPQIRGAQVQYVEKESPAADAGLCTGDIIIALRDHEIRSRAHLHSLVACAPLGEPVELRYFRDAAIHTATVTLKPGSVLITDRTLGLALMDLNKVVANRLNLERPQGALVLSVTPKGPAMRTGIKPGMVIAWVNATPVADIKGYKLAMVKYREAEKLDLVVNVRSTLHHIKLVRNAQGELQPVPLGTGRLEEEAAAAE